MINGKPYYVSDISEEDALKYKTTRKLIGVDSKNCMWFERDIFGRSTIQFKFAVEIPESKVIDWTYETCPLPPFTVKRIGTGIYTTAGTIGNEGVFVTEHYYSYKLLGEKYLYIPNPKDRTKELPCGSVIDETK